MLLFAFGINFEYILYFQPLILPCRCNPQTVSPFIRFLSEPLDKRNVIYAYMVVSFPVLVLLKRESSTLDTELSVKLRRIEITFQPNFLQLAQLLNYSFGEFQGIPAEVYQRQQLIYMREVTLYLVHILVKLGAFFHMFPFHCFNIPYQFFVLTFKDGHALLQFLPFRFQSIATQKRTYLCHECGFRLGLGGFQLLRLDFLFHFVKLPFRLLLFGLQLPHIGFKLSRLPFQVTVVLGGGGVSCFRTTDTTLQAIFRHCLCIAVVVGNQFLTCQ